jgi:2Fe-2S ferredoxin
MDSTSKTMFVLEIISEHLKFSHSIESRIDLTLLEHLNQLNVPIDQSCGGNGTCGTCKVMVLENSQNLSIRNDIEIEMSADRGFTGNERLSCQSYLSGSIKICIS